MLSKRYFNMIEVMLAIVVISLGLSSVFVLFPAGLAAHRNAAADNNTADLAEFAEAVIDRLCEGLSLEEQNQLVEQVQAIVDYACEQSATGAAPETNHSDALYYDAPDVDVSGMQGYEDLPGLSDVSQLSDDELAERMVLLLTCLRALGCSDLHLSGGAPPFVRRLRQVERIDSYVLTAEDSRRLNLALLTEERRQVFRERQDLSMALEIGADRFRVCLMEQKDGVSGSYRLVPSQISSLEELGFLEKDVVSLNNLSKGFVIYTTAIACNVI